MNKKTKGQQIPHAEKIDKILHDLLPYRLDFVATVDYVKKHLTTSQVGSVNATGTYQSSDVESDLHELRAAIKSVIAEDESFAYLYIALTSDNLDRVQCPKYIDTQVIKTAVEYNLNYHPLTSLDDYLEIEVNLQQYDLLTRGNFWEDDDDLYLDYFNRAYYLFSQLLRRQYTYTQLRDFLAGQNFDSDAKAYWTWQFISQLIDKLGDAVRDRERYQCKLRREIDRLEPFVMQQGPIDLPPTKGPFKLTSELIPTNFARILNVLCEMGCFTTEGGKKATKKAVFERFAGLVNEDSKQFHSLLNSGKNVNNDSEAPYGIFERMLQKL